MEAVTRWRACAVALALVAGGSIGLQAQSLAPLTAPVNDLAGVIDADSAAELDRRIRALHAATGDSVVVATVRTYAPFGSIEDYAVRLFEKAGIGDRDKDTGALVLLAVDDRAVRIEVGYGLEEFITDAFAGTTIRNDMLPEFRAGRYGAGLLAGTTRLIARVAERRGVTVTGIPAAQPVRPRVSATQVLIGAAVLVFVLVVLGRIIGKATAGRRRTLRGRRRRSTWSGWHGGIGGFGGGWFGGGGFGRGGGFGGFGGGGGFGGFGGGMSGGGGASGRF